MLRATIEAILQTFRGQMLDQPQSRVIAIGNEIEEAKSLGVLMYRSERSSTWWRCIADDLGDDVRSSSYNGWASFSGRGIRR